jgi:serine/threonine-protein kinase
LRQHRPEAPEALEMVILRCLEKDPARRFADVRALAEALVPYAPPSGRGALDRIRGYLGNARPPAPTPELLPDTLVLPPAPAPLAGAPPSLDTAQGVVTQSPSPANAGHKRALPLVAAIVAVACVAALGWVVFGRSDPVSVAAAPESSSAAADVKTATAPSATVTITLSTNPPDATVELDGAPAASPLHLPMDERTHKLVLRAPGHQPLTREIGARSDAYLELSLQKALETAPTAAPRATDKAPSSTPRPTGKRRNRGPLEQDL